MSRGAEPSSEAKAETPSEAQLLDRARALVPTLRERAEECEQLRQIPPQSIQDMKDAGLFRVLQPRGAMLYR